MSEARVITVDIGGHRYPIRSALEASYITELAAYVERKMRAAGESAPASDILGLAVLAALNIADELFRARQKRQETDGALNDRALQLERLVDDALAQIPVLQRVAAP